MRQLWIACLCMGVMTPTAFAAKPSHRNPVMDVSNLVTPGEWASTSVVVNNGEADEPDTGTSCISASEVHDFLNQSAFSSADVSYKLNGNHLHVEGPIIIAGKTIGSAVDDFTFDSPTTMHMSMTMKVTGHDGKTNVTTIKGKSHRIGPCTKGEGNDED